MKEKITADLIFLTGLVMFCAGLLIMGIICNYLILENRPLLFYTISGSFLFYVGAKIGDLGRDKILSIDKSKSRYDVKVV